MPSFVKIFTFQFYNLRETICRFSIIDECQDVFVVVVLVAWWDKDAAIAMNDGYLVVITVTASMVNGGIC